MNMKKIIIGLLVLGLLGGIYVWFFVYNKPHKDIANAEADIKIEASVLSQEFKRNLDSAKLKYADKVIEITGEADFINTDDSLSTIGFNEDMNFYISVELLETDKSELEKIKLGDKITVKALFVGYLEEDPTMDLPNEIQLKKGSLK